MAFGEETFKRGLREELGREKALRLYWVWDRPRDFVGHPNIYQMCEYRGDLYFALAPNNPKIFRLRGAELEVTYDPITRFGVETADGIGTYVAVRVWDDRLFVGGWLAVGFPLTRRRTDIWAYKRSWIGVFDGSRWFDIFITPASGKAWYYAEVTDLEVYLDRLFAARGDGVYGDLVEVRRDLSFSKVLDHAPNWQPLHLEVFNDQLYIVESTYNSGGTGSVRIGRWDGTTFTPIATFTKPEGYLIGNIARYKGRVFVFGENSFVEVRRDDSYVERTLFYTHQRYCLGRRQQIVHVNGQMIVMANTTDYMERLDQPAYMLVHDGVKFRLLRQLPSSVRAMALYRGLVYFGVIDYQSPHLYHPDAVPALVAMKPEDLLRQEPVHVKVWRGGYTANTPIGYIPVSGFKTKTLRVRTTASGTLTIEVSPDLEEWDVYDSVSVGANVPVYYSMTGDVNYIRLSFNADNADFRCDLNLVP